MHNAKRGTNNAKRGTHNTKRRNAKRDTLPRWVKPPNAQRGTLARRSCKGGENKQAIKFRSDQIT